MDSRALPLQQTTTGMSGVYEKEVEILTIGWMEIQEMWIILYRPVAPSQSDCMGVLKPSDNLTLS